MKPTLILIAGLLVILLLILSLASPVIFLPWQEDATTQTPPSPTPTGQGNSPPLHRQSGETRALKIGAGAIMLIIIGGLLFREVYQP